MANPNSMSDFTPDSDFQPDTDFTPDTSSIFVRPDISNTVANAAPPGRYLSGIQQEAQGSTSQRVFQGVKDNIVSGLRLAGNPKPLFDQIKAGYNEPFSAKNILENMKRAAMSPGAAPGIASRLIHKQDMTPDISAAITGMIAAPDMEIPKVAQEVGPAAWEHLAAVQPIKRGLGEASLGAVKSIQNSIHSMGLSPESFQGVEGLRNYQNVIDHAWNAHQSNFAQVWGPIQNETVNIAKYPELNSEFEGQTPTVRNLRDKLVDLNQQETAAKLYEKSPNAQGAVQGDLKQIRAAAAQNRQALYGYIESRTGVDVRPWKQAEQALGRLKDVAGEVANKTLLNEARFSTESNTPDSGNVVGSMMQAIAHPKTALASAVAKQFMAPEVSVSPLESFNSHMQEIAKGAHPGQVVTSPELRSPSSLSLAERMKSKYDPFGIPNRPAVRPFVPEPGSSKGAFGIPKHPAVRPLTLAERMKGVDPNAAFGIPDRPAVTDAQRYYSRDK